jgi:FkbM family methyltransferase
MIRTLQRAFHRGLLRTRDAMPFHVHRWMPIATLEPLHLLLAAMEARGEAITILQIGACDGFTNDPIHHFVKKGCARAILIEPNPYAFARLQNTYAGVPNVTLIQTAIGDRDGEAYLYRLKRSEKPQLEVDATLQIASFNKDHLRKIHGNPGEIERITVPCRSLSSLAAELGLSQIDLLQIDTEGFDASVVRMALEMPSPPACINFEHLHLHRSDRRPLYDLLNARDYLLSCGGWNILALQMQLLKKLQEAQYALPNRAPLEKELAHMAAR